MAISVWKEGTVPAQSTASTAPGLYDTVFGVLSPNNKPKVGDSAKLINEMSDPERKELALLLKAAGYKVPTTGKKSGAIALADAYNEAQALTQADSMRLEQNLTVREFLKNKADDLAGMGGTGSKKYNPYATQVIYDPTKAKSTVNNVINDLLGREATVEEIKLYSDKLKKKLHRLNLAYMEETMRRKINYFYVDYLATRIRQEETKTFSNKLDNALQKGAAAFLAVGAAAGAMAIKIGIDAVKAAVEDEKAQKSLAITLKNTTKATDAQVKSVEDYIGIDGYTFKLFCEDDDFHLRCDIAGLERKVSPAQVYHFVSKTSRTTADYQHIEHNSNISLISSFVNGFRL